MSRYFTIGLLFVSVVAFGQVNVTGLEYFIDIDPGLGSGIPLTLSAPGGNIDETFNINTTGLSEGIHFIGIRARDANGEWSMREFRTFYIRPSGGIQNPEPPSPVDAVEYFINTDPGIGNGTLLTNFPGTGLEVIFGEIISTSTLSEGLHVLGIRARDTDGEWGMYERRVFVIRASGSVQVPDPPAQIVDMEYFIDHDPGQGNGMALTNFVGNQVTIDFSDIAITNTVSEGLHNIFIRALDENGEWGMYEKRPFFVRKSINTGGGTTSKITALEYYFGNNDPGYGNGIQITVDPPQDSINYDPIDIATSPDIPIGINKVTFRAKNDLDQWGFPETREFNVIDDCLFPTAQFDVELACAGSAVIFNNTSTDLQGDATYRWYLDGDNVVDETTQNASFTYPFPGTYVVALAVRQGTICLDSIATTIEIQPQPVAVFSTAGGGINQPTSFTASASNLPAGSTWNWDFDGDLNVDDNTAGSTSFTYTSEGTFDATLTITDSLGCFVTVTNPITISTSGNLPPSVDFLASSSCVGSPVSFIDISQNLPVGSTYSWDFDGDGVEDASVAGSTTYAYPQAGSFNASLTITLASGGTLTASQPVEIVDLPTIDFNADPVCEGTAMTFTNLSTPGSGSNVYMWDFNNDGVVDSNASSDITYTYTSPGSQIVSLMIDNGYGCQQEIVRQVNVIPRPTANFDWNQVCAGVPVLFNNQSLSTVDGATYAWDLDGDGNTDATSNSSTNFTFPTSGTYNASLTVTNIAGCAANVIKPIEIIDIPEVIIDINARCYGQESEMIDLSQKVSPTANYYWDFGEAGVPIDETVGSTSHTYSSYNSYLVTLTIDNGQNCQASTEALVEFADAATPNFETNKLCEGEEVIFNDKSIANDDAIYSWDVDGDGLEDSANPNGTAFTYRSAGKYNATLTIDNGGNCLATKSIELDITPPPAVNIIASPDSILCEASTVTLDAGAGYKNYSWLNGGPQTQTYVIDEIGEYVVKVQNALDCFNWDTISVRLQVPPVPSFEYSFDLDFDGIRVNFLNTSTDITDTTEYEWDFGQGTRSTEKNPSVVFEDYAFYKTTIFDVCLVARNECFETEYCEQVFVSPTGQMEEAKDAIRIYPIPSDSYLNITLAEAEKYTRVALINSYGQPLWEQKNPRNYYEISLTELASGIYYIIAENEQQTVFKKVMKE